jgi:hypothetical protein
MSEIETRRSPADPADPSNLAPAGHNGGPPLDQEHRPEWGDGGIGNYFYWKAAHRAAWKNPSPGIVAFRIKKAERLGLTYEEYTLENSRTRPSPAGRGCRTDCRDQAGARRPHRQSSKVNFAEIHPHVGYPDQSLEPFARNSRDA